MAKYLVYLQHTAVGDSPRSMPEGIKDTAYSRILYIN